MLINTCTSLNYDEERSNRVKNCWLLPKLFFTVFRYLMNEIPREFAVE